MEEREGQVTLDGAGVICDLSQLQHPALGWVGPGAQRVEQRNHGVSLKHLGGQTRLQQHVHAEESG